MSLELEPHSARCTLMENFPVTVRIRNPNDFAVELPGFEFGYIEPELQATQLDGTNQRIFLGDTATRGAPVTLAPQSGIELKRLVYDSVGMPRWPDKPGAHRLTAKPPSPRARRAGHDDWSEIKWTIDTVEVQVDPPGRADEPALEYLRSAFEKALDNARRGIHEDVGAARISLFTEYLSRFAGSAYAPEIRWELAKLLSDQIGNKQEPYSRDPRYIELLDECLRFCLDRGDAFAEEFTRWNDGHGGSLTMEFAVTFDRTNLLEALASAIDRRYPDDAEGALFRRLVVVARGRSVEEARPVLDELVRRFPNGRYAGRAAQTLEFIERRRRAGE